MSWSDQRGEHTNDPEFRANRPKVLARDGNRCQIAGSGCEGTATEVDHKRNFKSGGSHDLANLQAVCATCHRKKTQAESARARAKLKRDAIHPDARRKHPGLK
ncbi:HNH endonuclease [Rhodococcus sp. ACS1]|uniref:HNH endonuclease n=1 Tax=Rhodococcus sp. ACS1 TaxID=2028570 RepID=UPI000BB11750|nr:HNH endonuclease signature motif containing protein [Rhodococcus sp. ACS1]PBC38485.1 HNH endonuclease [Rhodococcus sp. ACS1]